MAKTQDMKIIWDQIKKKLQDIAPKIVDGLLPGVTQTQVKELEEKLNVKLPQDFIAFYNIHNGQDDTTPWMIDGEEMLSFERISGEWEIWDDLLNNKCFETNERKPYEAEPGKGIKNVWWNNKWIPFTYDGYGNHLCLDLDPDTNGHYGQIIRTWHDDARRFLLANSFTEWIEQYNKKLQKGDLVYSEDCFAIINKKDV